MLFPKILLCDLDYIGLVNYAIWTICFIYCDTEAVIVIVPSPNFDMVGELYMKQLQTGFCLTYLIASLDETYPTDYISSDYLNSV